MNEGAMRELKTFKLSGSVDRAQAEVEHAVACGDDVAVSFRDVSFVSVSGLEWLEEILLRSQSQGASVSFVEVPPTIYKVFKVAHIDSLLEACGAPISRGPAC